MKIKLNRFRKGITTTLVRDYFIYSVLLFVLLLSTCFTIRLYISSLSPANRIEKLINKVHEWDDFDFPNVNDIYYVGEGGKLFLLDEDGSIIYTTDDLSYSDFTKDDLECIPKYGSNETYSLRGYHNKQGQQRYLLIKESSEGRSVNQIQGHLLMDIDRNIIEGTLFPEKLELSTIQILYLMGRDQDGLIIQQYPFQNKLGQNRILVIASNIALHDQYVDTFLNANNISWGIILLYILLVLCYGYFLYRKINKRFEPISKAIQSIDKNKQDLGITDQGEDEILVIAEKVTKVTEKLAQSEWENAYLNQSKHKLLADISHDIRTPITVIQGCALALRDGIVPEKQQIKYIETILKKSERVAELVNTFYQYSKLEHPDMPLHLVKQDICSIMQVYFANKYEELELSGFILEAEIPEYCVLSKIDDMLFCRALENLVNNSLKYNPPGTTIFVKLEIDETLVNIFLGDTGIGIPKELEDKLFEPFVTGESSRGSEYGSGLGLSIAKKIITVHHGKLTYVKNSKHHCKTEFLISLPKVK